MNIETVLSRELYIDYGCVQYGNPDPKHFINIVKPQDVDAVRPVALSIDKYAPPTLYGSILYCDGDWDRNVVRFNEGSNKVFYDYCRKYYDRKSNYIARILHHDNYSYELSHLRFCQQYDIDALVNTMSWDIHGYFINKVPYTDENIATYSAIIDKYNIVAQSLLCDGWSDQQYINVAVGRDGKYIIVDGDHRAVLSYFIGIPVNIKITHKHMEHYDSDVHNR